MKQLIQVSLALAASLLAGCAWLPQKVTIAPESPAAITPVGKGVTVLVTVRDVRPSARIGFRGPDSRRAEITAEQDLAPILRQKLIEGLTREGFKPVTAIDEPTRTLQVELRSLQYNSSLDFWSGTVLTKAVLQAHAKAGATGFDQLYVGERTHKTIEAPLATTNQKLINGSLTDALARLLTDPKLLKLLAE